MFSAGVVAVDVVPDTSRFYAELKARLRELRDLKVPVNFDPDDALATRTYERWNGREAKVNISYDVDMSGLRALSKQDEKLRRQYERPFRPLFDDRGLVDGLNRAIDRSKRLDAVQRKVGETFSKSNGVFGRTEMTRLKQQMLLLDQCTTKLDRARADRNELAAARADEWADLNRQILGNMSTLERLRREYDALGERIAKTASYRDMLRSEGRRDDAKAQTARLRELRSEYRAYGRNIREVTAETNRLAKRQDGLKSDSIAKWIHNLDKQIVDLGSHADTVRRTFNSIARESSQAPSGKTNILSGTSVLGRDWSRRMTAARKEQERLNDSWREGDELFGNLLKGTAAYSRNLKAASNVMASYRNGLKDANRLLDEQESQLKGLQDALHGVNRYGRYSEINRQLNDQLAATRRIRKQLEANPIKTKLVLDDSQFNRKYGNVTRQVRELTDKLERENELNIRVKFWEDTADSLEERLNRLRHERISIPVDIRVDNENLIARAREMAEKVRANPDRKVELEADLDLDMKHAEERIEEFKKKNDELDLDVDLETAAARAHLAYFTRPRTIDVFAKFHGTDVGKILNGVTYGASGLKGVENQFQNLVNLFDTLDKKVPRLALIGTVLSDIGAGAVNVAGTVGGLGKSIVSLSKAAYAAPAALTGLGAVFASFKMIYGDKGETWSSQIDFANTKVSQLSQNVQDAFYGKAKPAIMDTANAIGDSLVPEMTNLAKHEGEIVDGLMNAVRASYQANELPAIFDRVNESMNNLVPGAESLITALSHIGMVGGKYLPQFAQWLSEDASWFAKWAENVMNDSDRVDRAMSEVKEQAGYLGASLRSLKGIAQGVFTPLAQYQNGIEQFSSVLQRADRAINSMSAQNTLRAWVTGARDAQRGVRDAFTDIGRAANESRNDLAGTMTNLGQLTGNFVADVSRLASGTSGSVRTFSGDVRDGLGMVTSSIASASPMFSSLVRMAGQLSKTFGGTLANSLKAAAPTIETIANATSALSEAFSKLPAPIQGMLGLWMTFGRAGKAAWTALKTGALENIQSTMQYQNTLRQLGVTVDSTKVKFTELLAAMARLERNGMAANLTGDAMMYGNVAGMFTSSAKGMKEMSSEAEKAAVSVAKTGAEARLAAEGAVVLGANASSAAKGVGSVRSSVTPVKSALSGLKTVASDAGTVLMGAFGGPAGIALTAGLTVAGTAFSAYSQHVSKGKSEVESFNEAAKATPNALSDQATSLDGLKNRLDNFSSTVKNNLSTSRDFFDKFRFGEVSAEDYDSVSDALKKLGKNQDAASKATSGSNAEFDKYIRNLQKIEDAGSSWNTNSATGDMVHSLSAQGKAAQVAREGLQKLRKEQTDALQEQATAAGKNAGYVQTLLDEGQGYQEISDGLLNATEKKERLATVTGSLASQIESQRNANIQAAAASSSYEKTLQQVGEAMKTVNDLHSKGQQVWNAQKKDFDYTTEAGRTAADSLTALASSSNDYLNAMIKQGKSQKDVLARQKELSSNFNAQASAAGLDAAAVDGLNSSLLMTPKEVTTQINVQSLEAKENLANVVESMSYLFPDKNRKQVKDILLNSIWQGKTDANQLSDMVQRLSDGKHTVVITGDNKLAIVSADKVTKAVMKVPALKKVYLKAITEGRSDTDALAESISSIPALKDAFVKAKSEGKSDMDALKDAINSVPELKEAFAKAKTEGKSDVDALGQALKLIPDYKNTQLNATDNTGAATGSAKGNVASVPNSHGTNVNATDNTGAATSGAKGNISSVPKSHSTSLIGVNGMGGPASMAKGDIRSIPESHNTNITGNAGSLVSAAQSAWNWIKSIPSSITTTITGIFSGSGKNHANGGRIYGPGTGTSDSIPAWLSNGEAVLKASSLRKLDAKYGRGFFDTLNATGDVPSGSHIAKTSNTALNYRSKSRQLAYAAGGRITADKGWNVEVSLPENNGMTVNQTFNTKVVRSNDDLYAAAPILHRNALAEARRYQR